MLFSFFVLFCFYRVTANPYLTFSDGAKFADIGKNLVSGSGWGASFTRYSESLQLESNGLFSTPLIPPVLPLMNAAAFTLFGVADLSVIGVSAFFYLVLVVSTFLLGRKLWGNLAGSISAIAVAADINFLNYATSGASEPLFAVEIIMAFLLFTLKQKWSDVVGFIVLILMFFTRAHAPFFILPLLFYFIQLKTDNYKKTVKIISIVILVLLAIIGLAFVFPRLPFSKLLTERILVSLGSNSSFAPANDILRTGQTLLGKSDFLRIFIRI